MAIDFREKLGPLPVWAWGIIGGVIVVGGYYVLNRGGNDGDQSVTVLDPSGYQTSGIQGGSASIDETQSIDNNMLWLTRSARQVSGALSKSPSEVYAALQKWLSGQTITDVEKGYVDTALQQSGNPPEGTQGVSPVTVTGNRQVKYYRTSANTGRRYVIYTDGTFRELTISEYKKLGSPPAPKTDPKNITNNYKRVYV